MGFQILHRSGWVGTGDRPRQKRKDDLDEILLPPGVAVYDQNGINVNADFVDPKLFDEDWWNERELLMPPAIREEMLRRKRK